MTFVKWLLIGLVVVVILVAVLARFADGPVGPMPGGPLLTGELVDGVVGDWGFVAEVPEVELQLVEPPHSRTTWVLARDGRAYIPCGFANVRIWKKWPHQAMLDGRAIVRIEGRRYRVNLDRIDDADLVRLLTGDMKRKYEAAGGYSGDVWFFRLDQAY
jgi:hypothetical protein